ncbi:MAG: AAA family ATPase, partial [Acidimicrobiia bacterium]
MFLKALTLRGFKSFADKTVLEFEPGVMVVVGPNGSGKSNLVDAVAWVLGAQGPRTLRGGKMDDVIFAGTPDRPALGRAEVSLTIDNTANLLPIEFSEVTITRTLFRNGDSEYAINGAPCRLLDIQELLSDTGIGRQQHVIVGQGQLDAVLTSRPEDRRAVIEEAAGVLKYRKRRERAERRLEATEGNLLRLNDLLREVRRGLAPLQKQADAARRHDGLVEELRTIRLHLVGHELAGLQAKTERLRDQATELARNEAVVQARLRELDIAVLDAERALTDAGHGDVADALVRVESMRERARGLQALLAEKRRGLERELAAAADEGVVETLVADAGALRAELTAVEQDAVILEVRAAEVERLDGAVGPVGSADAELALAAAERQWRECENEAGRWQARAEALAQALESVRSAVDVSVLEGIEGIAGSLVEHLEIEAGAEAAVAAALGDAMHAIVVEGDDAARQA